MDLNQIEAIRYLSQNPDFLECLPDETIAEVAGFIETYQAILDERSRERELELLRELKVKYGEV